MGQDITKRKQAEKELQKSEDSFRSIFEKSATAYVLTSTDGRLMKVNNAMADMLGYSIEELQHINFQDITHLDDISASNNNFRSQLAGGLDTYQFEKRYLHRNGSIIWTFVSTALMRDNAKMPLYFITSITDITKRKLAEEALRASESQFRELWGITVEGIVIHDQGTIVEVNDAMCRLFGYSHEQAIGKSILDFAAFETKDQVYDHFKSGSEGRYETSAIRADGARIILELFARPIMYKEKIMRMVAVRDITERKRIEEALRESEERYRKLIEAFPDIIMLTDLNGNILYGNDPLERITGITPNDYNNPKHVANIHPDDFKMVSDAINDLFNSNKTHTEVIENRFIDSWGNLHWFSGRIAKLNINDQIVLQTVSRDITEKKIIEKELEEYRNRLEQLVRERTEELNTANEELLSQKEELQTTLNVLNTAQSQLIQSEKMASLGVLSAGIAHEINNPLNFIHGGILGIEKYFQDHLEKHINEVLPLLNAVNIGVERASAIVSSLSHYSRRDEMSKVECDMHAIINNCLIMLQNQLKDKVEIKRQYTKKPHTVLGNEGKLHQAILNIITNAEQSIDESGTITIRTEVSKDNILITIVDSGYGIGQEHLQKIFDPFFTTKAPGKGVGLGLSISYNIIQEHNGSIEFESQLGKGTKAIIKLPVSKT